MTTELYRELKKTWHPIFIIYSNIQSKKEGQEKIFLSNWDNNFFKPADRGLLNSLTFHMLSNSLLRKLKFTHIYFLKEFAKKSIDIRKELKQGKEIDIKFFLKIKQTLLSMLSTMFKTLLIHLLYIAYSQRLPLESKQG